MSASQLWTGRETEIKDVTDVTWQLRMERKDERDMLHAEEE